MMRWFEGLLLVACLLGVYAIVQHVEEIDNYQTGVKK